MSADSLSSQFHDRVGRVVIGAPIEPMRHAYLLPFDRIAHDPPQSGNVDWLHNKLAVLHLSYGALKRIGPLLVVGVVGVVMAGLVAFALIGGVKTGAHKVEGMFSGSSSASTSSALVSQLSPEDQARKTRCQSMALAGEYVSPECRTLMQEQ